jgi:hypothetical protein
MGVRGREEERGILEETLAKEVDHLCFLYQNDL